MRSAKKRVFELLRHLSAGLWISRAQISAAKLNFLKSSRKLRYSKASNGTLFTKSDLCIAARKFKHIYFFDRRPFFKLLILNELFFAFHFGILLEPA